MKRLLILLFCIASGAQGDDGRVSAAQCRKEIADWQIGGAQVANRHLSIEILVARDKDLLACEMENSGAPDQLSWMQLDEQVNAEIEIRYLHFLDRHGLSNQFFQEDENGAR